MLSGTAGSDGSAGTAGFCIRRNDETEVSMIEREVKVRVTDLASIRRRLESLGAGCEGVEHEVNRILDTGDAALQRRHEVLRVRSAGVSTMTWKGPAQDQDQYAHKTREELEVQFAAEGTEELLGILSKLGYVEALRYVKERETWRWHGTAIALDSLEFGDFVEIEGEAGAIQDVMHKLQIESEPREQRSYPELQRLAQQERARA
jgi:predicted adenylyl cyclase CyaB